jgi:putative membrane protein
MLKKPFQSYFSNGFSLFITSLFLSGLKLPTDIKILAVGVLALTIADLIVKPILKFVSIPINLLTMGLFNIVINVALLFGVLYIVDGIDITESVFDLSLLNLGIYNLDQTMSLIAAALSISIINYLLRKILF